MVFVIVGWCGMGNIGTGICMQCKYETDVQCINDTLHCNKYSIIMLRMHFVLFSQHIFGTS